MCPDGSYLRRRQECRGMLISRCKRPAIPCSSCGRFARASSSVSRGTLKSCCRGVGTTCRENETIQGNRDSLYRQHTGVAPEDIMRLSACQGLCAAVHGGSLQPPTGHIPQAAGQMECAGQEKMCRASWLFCLFEDDCKWQVAHVCHRSRRSIWMLVCAICFLVPLI